MAVSNARPTSAERHSRIIRCIWAACLLLAGLNHARILLQHGLLWDYGGVGWASAAYWSSLTILDPLAAALLFARPRWGIVAAAILIATNVAHNLAITRAAFSPQLLSQIAFLLFVAATARTAWRGAPG